MIPSFNPDAFSFLTQERKLRENIEIMSKMMMTHFEQLQSPGYETKHKDLCLAIIELLKGLKSSNSPSYDEFISQLTLFCRKRSDIAKKLFTEHYFELVNLLSKKDFTSVFSELRKSQNDDDLINDILAEHQGKPLSEKDERGENADVEFHKKLLVQKAKILQQNTEKIITDHLDIKKDFMADEILMQKVQDSLNDGKFVEARLWLRIYRDKQQGIRSEYVEPNVDNGLDIGMYISDTRFQSEEDKEKNGKTYIDYAADGLKYFQIAEEMLEAGYANAVKQMAMRFLDCLQHDIAGIDDPEEKARIAEAYLSDVISHYLVPYLGERLNRTNKDMWQQMLMLEKKYTDVLANIPSVTLVAVGDNSNMEESDALLQNHNVSDAGKAYARLPQNLSTVEKSAYENIKRSPEKLKLPSSTSPSTFFQRVASFFSGSPLPEGSIKRTAPGWVTYLASPLLYTVTLGQFSLFNWYTEKQYQSEIDQLNEKMDTGKSNQKIAGAYRTYVHKNALDDGASINQFAEICASHVANKNIVDALLPADKNKTAIEKIPALLTVSETMQEFFDKVASIDIEDYPEEARPHAAKFLQRSKETIQKIRNEVLTELAQSLENLEKDNTFDSLTTKRKILFLIKNIMPRLSELKLVVAREIDNQSKYKGLGTLLTKTGKIMDGLLAKTLAELNKYIRELEKDKEFQKMSALEKNAYLTELRNCTEIDSEMLKKLSPKVEYTVDSVSNALKNWVNSQTIENQNMLLHVLGKYATTVHSKSPKVDSEEINKILAEQLKPIIKETIQDNLIPRFFCLSHQLKLRFLEENPETKILSNEKYAEKRMALLLEDILKNELTPPEHLKALNADLESHKKGVMSLIQEKETQIDALKKKVKSIEESLVNKENLSMNGTNSDALEKEKKEYNQKILSILDDARPLKNLLNIEIRGIQSLLTSEYYLHGDDERYYKRLEQVKSVMKEDSRGMAPSADEKVLEYREAMDKILESIGHAQQTNKQADRSCSMSAAESFFRPEHRKKAASKGSVNQLTFHH